MIRVRGGLVLAVAAGLVLGGCAAGATASGGPTVSPVTGQEYAPGTPPRDSRFTGPATLFLAQEQYEQALAQAQQGIEADPNNARHYFLAGSAHAGLGDVEAAMEMWERAEEIYPAYELEIEPAREGAWAEAFNDGVRAYNAGDMPGAIEAWSRANRIFNMRPEAYLNLAVIHTQQNDYDRAIEVYREGIASVERLPRTRLLTPEEEEERVESRGTMVENLAQLLSFTERHADAEQLYRQQLERDPSNVQLQANLAAAIAQQGRQDEAAQMYTRLLSQPGLGSTDLFNIGVALFNAEDYERAAQAFQRVTEAQPNSRDAWYNYANALYAGQQFQPLVDVAVRLVELDPLHENSALILAQAYRETNQSQLALQALQRNQAAPIHLEDLQLRPSEGRSVVRGRAVGNTAAAGTPVQIRFTFFADTNQIGTQTVTVSAPAEGASTDFEAILESPQTATGYRYEVVP
jgi:tetratricopeptide (TPR) repeat protein